MQQNSRHLVLIKLILKIVHCTTREKKVYFASLKFDAGAKRDQQPHSWNKLFFSRVARNFFLLEGQKMDLVAPQGAMKYTLWPANRKNNFNTLYLPVFSHMLLFIISYILTDLFWLKILALLFMFVFLYFWGFSVLLVVDNRALSRAQTGNFYCQKLDLFCNCPVVQHFSWVFLPKFLCMVY